MRTCATVSMGLVCLQIERLERELTSKQADLTPDKAAEWLEERVAGLAAVVSDGDGHLATLIYNGGMELLQKDSTLMASQLVELKEVCQQLHTTPTHPQHAVMCHRLTYSAHTGPCEAAAARLLTQPAS
jgi:hypothetical protein